MIKKSRSTIDFNPLAEVELPDTKSSLKTSVKRKKVVKNIVDSSASLKNIEIGKNKKSIAKVAPKKKTPSNDLSNLTTPDSESSKENLQSNTSPSPEVTKKSLSAQEVFKNELQRCDSELKECTIDVEEKKVEIIFDEEQRYAEGHRIVEKWSKISISSFFIPVPLLDFALVSALQVKMLYELSKLYGIPFKMNAVSLIIGSILGGGASYFLSDTYTAIISKVPVVGPPIASFTVPSLAFATTYGVGYVFLEHFHNKGTFQDIELKHFKESIKNKVSEKYQLLLKKA
jgi:uncharacterized protein (DUF697 family)